MSDEPKISSEREAAAWHGLATNPTVSVEERLACALKALDGYEKRLDRLDADLQPIVADLDEKLDGDDVTDPIGYLETLQIRLHDLLGARS